MADRNRPAGGSPNANRNTLWAEVFVAELHRAGVAMVCISPGSRSAPLTMALARHGGFQLYNHVDERSGAYFALGYAKASGLAAAMVCTSGTAAANFYPAVIEAHYGQVPLVVITADRPPELRDVGAGQTIDQLKLYGTAVKWFHEVGTPEMTEDALRHLRTLAGRAVFEALRPPAGPVHLNFPFRKPLEPIPVPGDVPEELMSRHAPASPSGDSVPFGRGYAPWAVPAPEAVMRVAAKVHAAPRGLIVCGPISPLPRGQREGEWPHAVAELARKTGYPVLAEPPSQVRQGPHDRCAIIAHGEAILRAPDFRTGLRPELVLRFGAMPTAPHLEVLLDEHPDCPLVVIDPGGRWPEPTHHPTILVAADPTEFCRALSEALGPGAEKRDGGWLQTFQQADAVARQVFDELFSSSAPTAMASEWFEGRVFWELASLLPDGALQYTASSMPVRDLDAFTPSNATKICHLVNRGANGIDGTLSSALGAAAAHRGRGAAVLVTGDLAFYHDANGLLAAGRYGLPLTVIVINNRGGGIFDMLPISEFDPPFEEHFATPHDIDFRALAGAYSVDFVRPKDWSEFRSAVAESISSRGTRVIEIVTDRKTNRDQHRRIWQAVAKRLESSV